MLDGKNNMKRSKRNRGKEIRKRKERLKGIKVKKGKEYDVYQFWPL